MVLRLYIDTRSQPCRALLYFLRHHKVDFEEKHLDLLKGETRTPEHLELNPAHKLPFLHDTENDLRLSESGAILRYVVNKLEIDSEFYPREDLRRRALIDKYLDWSFAYVRQTTSTLYGVAILLPLLTGIQPEPALIAEKEASFKSTMEQLDEIFAQREYLVDNSVTYADIYLL